MPPRIIAFAIITAVSIFLAPRILAAPVEITTPELRGAIQPQVAVAPSGRIHVVFGKGYAIYHTASSDGRNFSKPVKVGEVEKLALGMRRGPRVVATDKVIVVTAISHADGNIHAWDSTDGGQTWQEQQRLNDSEKAAREGLHAMAGNGNGFVFATWLDLRAGGTQLWGARSLDGGVTWGANALIYKSPDGHICECCHPSVAVDAAGRVAVMWRNWLGGARDLYLARSTDRAQTFAAAQKLGEGTWKLNGCPMDGGSIAIGSKGDPMAVWRRERSIFASDSAAAEQRLSDSGNQALVLATSKGASFLWESDGGLMLQTDASLPARFAEHARMAAGAPRSTRGAIVVWESTSGGTSTILADSPP